MAKPDDAVKPPDPAELVVVPAAKPTATSVCTTCGAVIGDAKIHDTWHQAALNPRAAMMAMRQQRVAEMASRPRPVQPDPPTPPFPPTPDR